MTETNYLCWVARRARECHSNYVAIPCPPGATIESRRFQDALRIVPRAGLIAFCFLEPSAEDLIAAEAAGIRAVYYGISKHDAARLIHNLKPRTIQRAREWILENHVENHVVKWGANDSTVSKDTGPGSERDDLDSQIIPRIQTDTGD